MDRKMLSRMRNICSRREYCTRDILSKLEGCPDADEIISSLKRDNYLNDLRYASAFARDKSSITGWGPVKIRFALSSKDISKADIDLAMAEIDEVRAGEKLERTLVLKYKTLQGDTDCRLKLIRFALGRGYEWGSISPVIDKILKSDNI